VSHDLKQLQQLAKQHDINAINELGDLYFNGEGVEQDFHKAFDYYFRAAELGHASAQYHLGRMYEEGKGAPVDSKKSMRFYLLAAEQNHPDAQHHLATLFREGNLIKQDLEKSFFWYEKSASNNNHEAEYFLGCQYLHGEGTTKDEIKAEALFLKSAESIVTSKRMLGQIFRDRNDLFNSIDWYEQASQAGDIESYFMLGLFYQMGPEEWQDLSKAADAFFMAAKGKHQEARSRLEKLAKENKSFFELFEKLNERE
jgi:TPR repeat protein